MSNLILVLLAVPVLALLLYGLILAVVSFVSVRPPRIPVFLTPGLLGDPEEKVSIVTDDGVELCGWWVQGQGETVLVCLHGFLANRSELVPFGPRLRQMGVSMLYLDHRCHGESQRAKCTFGFDEARDVKAAVDYARERSPGCRVVLFGSSMGAVAAARATANQPGLVDALILDGAYANLEEAAKGFWYVTGFRSVARLLAPTTRVGRVLLGTDPRKVNVLPEYAKLKGVPVLFLYGTSDTVVPLDSARQCVLAAGAEVEWFEGSGHAQGRFSEPERYFDSIVRFLGSNGFLELGPRTTGSHEAPIISSVGNV